MKNNLILISCMVCFLYACKKESDISPNYPSCRILKEIQKFSFGETDTIYPYYEYVYEGNKLVKRFLYQKVVFSGFEGTSVYLNKVLLDSLIYDGNKVFENYHTFGSSLFLRHERFIYEGDKIVKITFVDYNINNISSQGEICFKYTGNQLTESSERTISAIGEILNTIRNYKYSGENLSSIDLEYQYSRDTNYSFIYYGPDTTTFGVETYDNYDEKENPYKAMFFIEDLRIRSLSKNNYQYNDAIINIRNGNSELSESRSINGYNENAYPINFGYTELVYNCDN